MFDAVRNNPKIVQVFLVLITLPFAFFGIDHYFRNGGPNDVVAKVGKTEITSQQLEMATRQQEMTMREQFGDFDRSILDTPEFKAGVLDRLINETTIKTALAQNKFVVSDAVVQDYIKGRQEFQDNGKFSLRLYDAILASAGKTRDTYQAEVRQMLAQAHMLGPVVQSAVVPKASVLRWAALDKEERSVAEYALEAAQQLPKVKLEADAARKFYDANPASFRSQEMVKLEYVVLSSDAIARGLNIGDAEAKAWYEENAKNMGTPEERRASHILVQVAHDATADAKAAAKKKAEEILAEVKKAPARFAEFAKKDSDDKGSAAAGGDLGFFGRNAMVKPFEDAAFSLKTNEISGLVESEFGYHIIMVTDARGGKVKSFEEAKAEALAGARKQAVEKRYAELADEFSNMVYNEPDALKPVAEKFKLPLVQTDWLPRTALKDPALQNPKLQAALFSQGSLNSHQNTEAVDLGNGSIASARIVDYKASALKPFEEVAAEAERLAREDAAAKLAASEGQSLLEKLQKGDSAPDAKQWKAAKAVTRSAQDLGEQARKAIFGAPAEKLPAYVAVARGKDYVIYRIDSVKPGVVSENDPAFKDMVKRYEMAAGDADLRAYVAGLRTQLGVKINEKKK